MSPTWFRLLLAALVWLPVGPSRGWGADVVNASVRVAHYRAGEPVMDGGSGTVLAVEGGVALVSTNRHVCPDAGWKIVVYSADKLGAYEARWLGVDAAADLSLLVVEADGHLTPAAPALSPVEAGGPLTQVGYPHGVGPTRREGTAIGCDCRTATAAVYRVNIACASGDSGSGVFNAAGEVVAVLWGGAGGQSSCVSLGDLSRFVTTNPGAVRRFPSLVKRLTPKPN